jgi:hypothetical protein
VTDPDALDTLDALDGKVIWSREYVESRFIWKRRYPLWVLALAPLPSRSVRTAGYGDPGSARRAARRSDLHHVGCALRRRLRPTQGLGGVPVGSALRCSRAEHHPTRSRRSRDRRRCSTDPRSQAG